MVIPVDFPLDTLDPLLDSLAQAHQQSSPSLVQETLTDEGVDVTLLAFSRGPMYLQLFLRIRTESGDLGVPVEAELTSEQGRIPLYRAEFAFWPEAEGVASLLSPLPQTDQPLTLRIRQIRLFSLGAGSRFLKIHALAVRPRQAPPVRLAPADEERYRYSLAGQSPAEPHRDVFGYWDFTLRIPPPPPMTDVEACQGSLKLPGSQSIGLVARGPRLLAGQVSLDWLAAFRQPPVWEGLSTLHTDAGPVGIGTFQPDGRVTWLFTGDLPHEVMVRGLHLYRIPASPAIQGAIKSSALPLLAEVQASIELRELTTVQLVVGRGTEKTTLPVLHAWVEAALDGVPGRIRPGFRFWSQADARDRFEIPMSWKTPGGELLSPLPADIASPTSWDVPWLDFLLPQRARLTPADGPAPELAPAFVPPPLYSTSPLRMA